MLKQLSGLDSMFLFAESATAPLELSSLQIYDPATHPDGRVKFREILAMFAGRTERSPVFRRKLRRVPLSLDNPYWVEDDEFDLEYHVRHIALPRPGNWRQLMELVARLQAEPLDLSRPLWVVYIIEGLDEVRGIPGGCFGMFMKMHHATIDGVSGQEIQQAIHDVEPLAADAGDYEPEASRGSAERPSPVPLLLKSPVSNLLKSVRLGAALAGAAPGLLDALLDSFGKTRHRVPETVFNRGRIASGRVVDGHIYDLATMKAVAKAAGDGVTINDVALSLVAGALRRYLEAKDDLPAETLVAACPVSVRGNDDKAQEVDKLVSVMMTPLHTEIADPLERIRAIRDGTREAKATMAKIGPHTLAEIALNLPAPVARSLLPLIMELGQRTGMVFFNTVVTNVAGIQRPVYLAGAEMVATLGMGPVVDRAGLFHAVFSCNDRISLMFTACREMLPDPAFYAECIDLAYAEIRAALPTAVGAAAKGHGKAAKKRAPGKNAKKKRIATKRVTETANEPAAKVSEQTNGASGNTAKKVRKKAAGRRKRVRRDRSKRKKASRMRKAGNWKDKD